MKNRKGLTLIEIMISLVVMSIFVFSLIMAFQNTNVGIFLNRSRTIANALAEEKIEIMKNIDYYRLLVTCPPYNTSYDQIYYPPETFIFGNKSFERRILVEKVKENPTGELVTIQWDTLPDVGLKKITVYVVWNEGGDEKSYFLSNLVRNPDYEITAKIVGTVKNSTTSLALEDVQVFLESMPVYETYTNSAGKYSLDIPEGLNRVVASKHGYFLTRTEAITLVGEQTIDFNLLPKGYGSAAGVVWKHDHLVISQVCAEVWDMYGDPLGRDRYKEVIQLYNPTTYQMLINTTTLKLIYVDDDNNQIMIAPAYKRNTISSKGFLLFVGSLDGATSVYNNISGDATYYALIPIGSGESGGVCIRDSYGIAIDSIAWGNNAWKSAPASAKEGDALILAGSGGLLEQWIVERKAHTTATLTTMGNGQTDQSKGHAFDTQNNNLDLVGGAVASGSRTAQNSLSATETPVSGTPASGAIAFADDDLSSMVVATTGYYYITQISTGAWTLTITSGTLFVQTTFYMYASSTVVRDVVISSVSPYGYIMGTLLKANLQPNSGIRIDGGGQTTTSGSSGRFVLPVPTGTITVTINTNLDKPNYIEITTGPFNVDFGDKIELGQIIVYYNGGVSGTVTSSGGDPLANVVIIAADVATLQERANDMTDINGQYSLSNLASDMTDTYYILPYLSETSGETSTPARYELTFTSTGTYFTDKNFSISQAYAVITGTVTENNQKIKTGVLIIATTSTIAGDPSTINSTFRSGSQVYYSCSSGVEGYFSINVPGAVGAGTLTYYLYAWYSKLGESEAVNSKKSTTIGASAGGKYDAEFSWP